MNGSSAIPCPHRDLSGWGRVMINPGGDLCEVGDRCPATACRYHYTEADVVPCPTCHGNMVLDAPPYGCTTCDVFGIMRIVTLAK